LMLFIMRGEKLMELKNTLIKSITAILCVIAICLTAVSGANKYCDAVKDLNSKDAQESASDEIADESSDNGEDAAPADETGNTADETADETASSDEATAGDNSAQGGSSSSDNTNTGSKSNGDSNNTSGKSGSNAPSSTADILNFYNNATAKANQAKVGFNKQRYADNASMPSLGIFSTFKDKIEGFIGLGSNKYNENIAKGNWAKDNGTDKPFNFLDASKLTAGDVTSAKCVASGNTYTITLKLKNGSSSASKDNPTTQPNSALDKCGICTGVRDHDNYDHKTATIIYAAIKDVPAVNNVKVKESYSNATVTAVINASTGQFTSLSVDWSLRLNLSIVDGDATGNMHVKYSNFKY
ncbi:MAG: hypothetical protein KBT46_00135, partial [Ruminococcus sp.]|nr:hypothetical protein [Candidatus Copronaster equi]